MSPNNPNGPRADSADSEPREADSGGIEERIDRIRRLHGWTSDTNQLQAVDLDDLGQVHIQVARPRLVLSYEDSRGAHRQVEVDHDPFEIGSGEHAHLRLLEPSVSARHARIHWDDGHYRVRDLHSAQGTRVDGEPVPLSHQLDDGCLLELGAVALDVSIGEHGPRQTTSPHLEIDQAYVGPEDQAPSPVAATTPAPAAPAARAAATREGASANLTRPPTTAYLTWFDEGGGELELRLDHPSRHSEHPESVLVGRKKEAQLRLTDPNVSGRHCSIGWENDALMVRDLGSTNGTWVGEQRVTRHRLSDGDIVRCGVFPIRVGLVSYEDLADLEYRDWGDEGGEEVAPPRFHLVYRDDHDRITALTLSEHEPLVAMGSGACEINIASRGLEAEHAQLTWDEGALVLEPRSPVSINEQVEVGPEDGATALKNGDQVSAGSFDLIVVRSGAVNELAKGKAGELARRWAEHFAEGGTELELLFIDATEPSTGRSELCMWGDGLLQLEIFGAGEHQTLDGRADRDFVKALLGALERAGFPDPHDDGGSAHRDEPGLGCELHAFCGPDRADLVIDTRLALRSAAYAEARDLMRAVARVLAL